MAHSLLDVPECLAVLATRCPVNQVPRERRCTRVPHTVRARRWWVSALAAAALTAAPGCFLRPINRAPIVMSIEPDFPVVRGQEASFTAVVFDPDSDSFTLAWAAQPGTCPSTLDMVPPTSPGDRLTVDKATTARDFCVWAVATDRYGAVGVRSHYSNPVNMPPMAVIDLLGPSGGEPYRLYSTFALSSRHSSDPEGDPITKTWSLTPAPGSQTARIDGDACPSDVKADGVVCFTADAPGPYQVQLEVSDGSDSKGVASKTLNVDKDRFPCILMPEPSISGVVSRSVDDTHPIVVHMVDDDGDPSPSSTANRAHFTWYYSLEGGDLQPVENDFPQLYLGTTFKPGDMTAVRVEVHDRNRQAIDAALLSCGDNDLCPGDPARPSCFQRVTWRFSWL